MSGLPGPWSIPEQPQVHGAEQSPRNEYGLTQRYVVGFLFWEHMVLLIRKDHPEWQRGKLNGVGGHVEPGETYLQAMHREFFEEAQIVTPVLWEHFATLRGVERGSRAGAPSGQEFEIAFFCARSTTRPPVTHSDIDEPTELVPATALLVGDVLPNLQWLVPLAYYAHRADWPFLVYERQDIANVSASPDQQHADMHCDTYEECQYCHCGEAPWPNKPGEPSQPCPRCGKARHLGEYYNPSTGAHGDV